MASGEVNEAMADMFSVKRSSIKDAPVMIGG
jgi:hypothetical protein